MIDLTEKLGVGLYTPAEAALYARIPIRKLSRWFFGDGTGEAVAEPQFNDERVVSFLDFVQAMAIHNVRTLYNIPLPKIRLGIERAKREFNVPYPLARRRTIFLFGQDLFINVGTEEGAEFRAISGKNRHQRVMRQVVEAFADDLGFDATGLATSFQAFQWEDKVIKMDPRIRLGAPIVMSCGYSAQSLWEACIAEGGFEQAARAYGVAPADVKAAFKYFDHLMMPQKAA